MNKRIADANTAGEIMIKKWIKRILKGIVLLAILLALVDVGLQLLSRTEWFNTKVTQALQQALGREFHLGSLGANLRGIFVENLQVAEQGGFEKGTFLEAGHLRVRFSLIHLLHAHTKIDEIILANVTLRARVSPDGSTNWADLIAAQDTPPQQDADQKTSSFPLVLTAGQIRLEDLHLIYTDQTVSRIVDVDELTIRIKHFSLHKPFTVRFYAQLRHHVDNTTLYIPLSAKLTVDLQNLELARSAADIHSFTATLQDATLRMQGRVENFVSPQTDLQITLQNISSKTLENIVKLPAFDLKKATARLKTIVDTEKSALTVHHVSLEAPGVTLQTKGGLLFGNPQQMKYDFSTQGTLVLGEIGRWFTALADPYQLIGTLNVEAHTTHQKIDTHLDLQEVGAQLPQAGRIANVNTTLSWEETMDFKTGNAHLDSTGKLNGRPFTLLLKATQQPDLLDVNMNLSAQELILLAASDSQPVSPAPQSTDMNNSSEHDAWPLPPIRVAANVQLDHLSVPYFEGNQVAFTADMQGLTPDLKQAHGNLRLTTAQGTIQDIYKLTDANALTKVLFLSLNLTGKVFNSLNVLGVLGSIGGGITDAITGKPEETARMHTQTILGPDGQPLEVEVPTETQKVDGQMPYDKFDTQINFVQGVATIKEGTFVSPMMSLRLDGTTNFNTQAVDLTVHAAPGRHEVNGMMPLTLKIGGTVDNPQGSMQLLGSVGALVTQGVTNNVVSRNVKKGIKGFFGLFKKDKREE